MTFNSVRNGEFTKKKWVAAITTLALFIFVIGLIGASVVSFFQTQDAFKPLNDPTIIVLGLHAGNSIAFLFSAIFQYGQNAALFIKKHYCSGAVIANLWIFQITDKTLCDVAFTVCAVIDAGTNCIWLSKQSDVSSQPLYIKMIEYSVMILVVWVEEVLGIALQGLSHSATELRKIIEHERSGSKANDNSRENRKRVERPLQEGIRGKLPPVGRGENIGRYVPEAMRISGSDHNQNKPSPTAAPRPLYNEPTYHPIKFDDKE